MPKTTTIWMVMDCRSKIAPPAYADRTTAIQRCERLNRELCESYPEIKGEAWHVETLNLESAESEEITP